MGHMRWEGCIKLHGSALLRGYDADLNVAPKLSPEEKTMVMVVGKQYLGSMSG